MAIIAPSLLAADFLELGKACSMLNASEAEWFHLDVMDGVFVPNISYGLPIIEQIKKERNGCALNDCTTRKIYYCF